MSSGYSQKKIVVTGGLGFIGSNLAVRLVELGARVTVVDSLVRGCGGNHYNLHPVEADVRLIERDIAEAAEFRDEIAGSDLIFNLAGEISHIHSMRYPQRDARLNASAHLAFLQECVRAAPGIRVIYASTRQIYGMPRYLPVDETHPVQPVDFNGIHKFAAHSYHLMWSHTGELDAAVLCLTNIYGPRMALDAPCQGFLNNFSRKLVQGEVLEVFGDGLQLRDPLFVDDAVEAFLQLGLLPRLPSRAYNLGGPEPLQLRHIAELASRAADVAPPVFRPFPPELRAIDIGSYYTDATRIRAEVGWRPAVRFEEGIARLLEYYRRERTHYLDSLNHRPSCKLEAAGRRTSATV